MKVLHLRGDRLFAQQLRSTLALDGYDVRGADTWEDLFQALISGPYPTAILQLRQPVRADERNCLHLAAEAQ